MSHIVATHTDKPAIQDAVAELETRLAGFDPRLVLYFASSRYDQAALAEAIQEAFPGARTFGCSTAGEIVTGKMLKQSISVMAWDATAAGDVAIQVVEDLSGKADVKAAFAGFEQHFGSSMRQLDYRKHVGIVLVDGLSGAEERLMDKIGNLTDVLFIGASAGDDLAFSATHVHADGKAHTNAAVLALLAPGVRFDFIKTQSFCALGKRLVPTKVVAEERAVVEFNGKPAAQAYAEAVGVPVDQVSTLFMRNPVGLMDGDEPFVRSPQQVVDGGTMKFYCNVAEGLELSLLESTDIIKDTREAVERKKRELGGLSAIVNFHCILRTLELEGKGLAEEYGKIFSDVPTVGFSTYGEEFLGHINQTSTMLVFN